MSDLIKREDAREAIEKLMDIHFDRQVVLAKARDAIVWLPSADRPTGRWVRKEKEINDCDGRRAYYWYECDNCGARPPKDQWGNEWHSDFCPNCGCAMMEGGDSE